MDLIFCCKQAGATIGRLCEKCDGKCVTRDSSMRIHDECDYGSYQGAVRPVEALESLMPIIARSVPSRRTEMVAQRPSIWGALRQISSMMAKIWLQEEVTGRQPLPSPPAASRKAWSTEHRPRGPLVHWHLSTLPSPLAQIMW